MNIVRRFIDFVLGKRPTPCISDAETDAAIKSIPRHYSGLEFLQGGLQSSFRWTGQNPTSNISLGGNYSATENSNTLTKTYNIGTTNSNTASGGGDEVFSFITSIAGGGSATLNLDALTNTLGQAAVAIARSKSHRLWLLSATDDSTLSPAPAATSTVTVTNFGVQVPAAIKGQSAGSGLTVTITVSTGAIATVAIGAAGSGYPASATFAVLPQQAGGSGGVIIVTTNSSGVPTTVSVGQGGSGYSAATIPTVLQFFDILATGNMVSLIDVSGNGIAVSATQKNIQIINNDPSNTVYCELDMFGASS